jgi:hypothetical protein
MSLTLAMVLVILAGWCGTPPQPEPNPFRPRPLGAAVVGAIVGYVVLAAFGADDIGAASLLAGMAGAFVSGRLVSDILGALLPPQG